MDNYLLDVSKTTPNVRTAIVLPPIIYGKGEGPGNQRSIQIPSLCRVTLERGHVVRAGQGLNRWGSIHVKDIARLFTALAQGAHEGRQDDGLWNDNGIYLSNAGEMVRCPPLIGIVSLPMLVLTSNRALQRFRTESAAQVCRKDSSKTPKSRFCPSPSRTMSCRAGLSSLDPMPGATLVELQNYLVGGQSRRGWTRRYRGRWRKSFLDEVSRL